MLRFVSPVLVIGFGVSVVVAIVPVSVLPISLLVSSVLSIFVEVFGLTHILAAVSFVIFIVFLAVNNLAFLTLIA